jgi:hypothetical protein
MVIISWFYIMMTLQSILKLVPNARMQGLFMTLLWKVDKIKRWYNQRVLGVVHFFIAPDECGMCIDGSEYGKHFFLKYLC